MVPGLHELMRGVPPAVFAIMVTLALGMTALAGLGGWYARHTTMARTPDGPHAAGRVNDPLYAGLTMALVPFAFAVFMLWGRFG